MNVFFLTITPIEDFSSPSVHIGVLKKFRDEGNEVYIVTPYERKLNKPTRYVDVDGVHILHVKTANITKCGIIEKGISTLTIDKLYKHAINKYISSVEIDLILYSTPPITLYGVIRQLKKRYNAMTYLMLKDIFPQNAVDIGIMSKRGVKGFLYRYFRAKEKRLYQISDYIGCMSEANVDYILKHNAYLSPEKVEVCPNTIDVYDKSVSKDVRDIIRDKYGIPIDNFVFVYGGNLGKPQGIPFLIECLESVKGISNTTFLVVGDGTEYSMLEKYSHNNPTSNLVLKKRLPKEDYDTLVAACDVGMIFLDHRFTIPNFPSRLLSYMQAKIPILACTDPNTDIGKVIVDGGFGWWCESNNANRFKSIIEIILESDIDKMKEREFEYLKDNYSANIAFETIMSHFS